MSNPNGYWSTDGDDKLALLSVLWLANYTARQIVQALTDRFGGKVTRNAVISKVHRLGLPMHQPANNWRKGQTKRRAGA